MKIVRPSCALPLCSQSTSFRVYRFLVEPPICQCCIYAHATLWCIILNILPMSNRPNVPSWCALPKNSFCRVWFKALCMIAISSSSVEHWEKLLENSKSRRDLEAHTGNSEAHIQKSIEKWEKHKKMVLSRFENMNLIVSISGMLLQLLKPIYRRVW
jgi:uncharacterized protein YerC